MIKYDDLLGVPFKAHGRDKSGMDCYGLVLECLRREGKSLPDFFYEDTRQPASEAPIYASRTGARETAKAPGTVAEYDVEGNLHCGYMLDRELLLHMTHGGVRVSPIGIFKNVTFYEVQHGFRSI